MFQNWPVHILLQSADQPSNKHLSSLSSRQSLLRWISTVFVNGAEAFVEAMQRVWRGDPVSLPTFEHGVGDPVEAGVQLLETHTIVVVEGNYVLLGAPICPSKGSLNCKQGHMGS